MSFGKPVKPITRLLSAGKTDIGLRRENNEDAFLHMPEYGLFALSDGMGGAAAGEIASRFFIETVQSVFRACPRSPEEASKSIQEVFSLSSRRMRKHAAFFPEDKGMGCTGDVLICNGAEYIIGHIGDSRIYLLRDHVLRQLTKDHTVAQLQMDQGKLTAAEGRSHPGKNILLRAIGTGVAVSCDILQGTAIQGDIFLLCSDGLTDMLNEPIIQACLDSARSLEDKASSLVSAALAAGGRDNVTVVLCQVEAGGGG